ncbi:MAG: hypothetical protein AUJ92_20920 [Armatimonadetes bacterium CG2_30_59_28]|nr:hypothetical protein [Armatimonadota bacterium]OIO89647.1 MAG: hypothetical protein AUJ92_20920 [Armatimonadetes bacterium CG2_30_59_28]PIU60587.1 MAG: hypothetical protein COS85_23685 [Armatimonadetes bacterium CG07_land_8_20_14_0_80_59_28]PIX39661.1 MAG: hypothetical protein COZ56_16825 [Armatimonadetes bacterium CG_4_8_14_3_um_filter_58_9]PIY42368.1 MAG: hypothetical protein COZ05_14060 [Armatimonadetes bacterium CG_4_10_14_3_um_filter_59_10]
MQSHLALLVRVDSILHPLARAQCETTSPVNPKDLWAVDDDGALTTCNRVADLANVQSYYE